MERLKVLNEARKCQDMIKSGEYIVVTTDVHLTGLLHRRTGKMYTPKYELFVTY